MGGSKGGSSPPKFEPGKYLKQATETYLKYAGPLQEKELAFRKLYSPQLLDIQQEQQRKYGPEQYREQLAALQQLDPQGTAIRQQLGTAVSQDLGTGYDIPPALQQAVASQYLGRQVAGGNVLGNAAATGADIYAGNAAQQWHQQNEAAAQRFLQGPTPEQQLLSVQPVAAPNANQFINPSAPAQAAQNYYQNYLAQYQASGAGQNSGQTWGQAIGATAGGILGGIYGGPAGSQLGIAAGGGIGGQVGYVFSDARLKHHIVYVGQSPNNLPIYEFCYKNDCENRYRGTIAQHIMHLRPDAVKRKENGFYYVNYNAIDINFEKVQNLVEA